MFIILPLLRVPRRHFLFCLPIGSLGTGGPSPQGQNYEHRSVSRHPQLRYGWFRVALNWTFYTRVIGQQSQQIAAAHPGIFREVVPASF